MSRHEVLREIQKRIAEAKGYRLQADYEGRWTGSLRHGPFELAPRWPMDWCDAGVLVEEMAAWEHARSYDLMFRRGVGYVFRLHRVEGRAESLFEGEGQHALEAISRCWCAWKGIDLSDLS